MPKQYKTLKISAPVIIAASDLLLDSATIVVDNGMIKEIGPTESLTGVKTDKTIRLKDGLLSPGLINTHCHLELSHLADQLKRRTIFTHWIEDLINARAVATKGAVSTGVRRAVGRLMETGVTSIGDVTSAFDVTPWLVKSGLRAVVYHETLGYVPGMAQGRVDDLKSRLAYSTTSDLIRLGISPHAVYSVSDPLFKKVAKLAKSDKRPMAVHLCETMEETEFCKTGKGPFATLLKRRGLLDLGGVHKKRPAKVVADSGAMRKMLCIHFNHPTRSDMSLLQENGASVAFCPNSNKWFKRNFDHPLPKLIERGISVGLGTDSLASNTDLDIRSEAREIMRLYPDMDLETIFMLMTTGGALAMGMPKGLGELKPGAPFDAVHFNVKISGRKNLLLEIIKSRGSVKRSWVAGREIFKSRG